MNQPLKQHEPATTTHLRSAGFAAGVSLSTMLALGLGCTGSIGNPDATTGPGPGMSGGTAGAGAGAALARLVPANAPTDAAGKARAFVTSFGQRAFRRPLTDAEVTTHLGVFNLGPTLYPGVDTFKAGVSLVIQAMLQSPFFLYRTELGTAAPGATQIALNDWEVGAKLALTITNTIPDDTLLAAAAAGQLHDKAAIAAQ